MAQGGSELRRSTTRPELAAPAPPPPPGVRPATSLLTRFAALAWWQAAFFMTGLAFAIFTGDASTGAELSLSILYLLPIALASWRFGRVGGVSMALFCVGLTYAVDKRFHHGFTHPGFLYWDVLVHILFFLAFTMTLAELRGTYLRLADIARLDGLTGLANRRRFYELAEHEFNRARRSSQPMTLVLIDVDNFKKVNDTMGHQEGDHVLETVAAILKRMRKTDIACRVGGDEFLVLMPDTSEPAARTVVEKLLVDLRAAVAGRWPVSFSMGVVTCTQGAPPAVESLVHAADEAMYRIKHGTKDGAHFSVLAD